VIDDGVAALAVGLTPPPGSWTRRR
jgi:hypothetical protein